MANEASDTGTDGEVGATELPGPDVTGPEVFPDVLEVVVPEAELEVVGVTD